MIDIYTIEKPKNIYESIVFDLLCHTSHGDENDKYERFYEKGEWYKARLEFFGYSADSNNMEFRGCWVSHSNKSFGSRFAVSGNVYHTGKPYWTHFTKLFYDPIQLVRDKKIENLLL